MGKAGASVGSQGNWLVAQHPSNRCPLLGVWVRNWGTCSVTGSTRVFGRRLLLFGMRPLSVPSFGPNCVGIWASNCASARLCPSRIRTSDCWATAKYFIQVGYLGGLWPVFLGARGRIRSNRWVMRTGRINLLITDSGHTGHGTNATVEMRAERNPTLNERTVASPTVSFAALYKNHFAFVWRNLRRLGVPESVLRDAAQDVFMVVHRRSGEFEGRGTEQAWLYSILR